MKQQNAISPAWSAKGILVYARKQIEAQSGRSGNPKLTPLDEDFLSRK